MNSVLAPDDSVGRASGGGRLLLVSMSALYVELLLIRWIGTEVRVFAYIQNLALIACFLGFGVGCFQSTRSRSPVTSLYTIAAIAVIVSIPSPAWHTVLLLMSNLLTLSPDAALWGMANIHYSLPMFYGLVLVAVLVVGLLLWLLIQTMIPFGRQIGFYFDHADSVIRAYTINLAGSLAGVCLLAVFSYLWLPPVFWIGIAFFMILMTEPRSRLAWLSCVLLMLAVLLMQAGKGIQTFWSPYQKISVWPLKGENEYLVEVNNTGYMTISNVTQAFLRRHPDVEATYQNSSYDSPFLFAPSHPRVLVVGAGGGNDVAAALRHGASHVDAVEIDPVIYSIGKRLHPEHPYDSDKVTVIINDARNLLRRSSARYDVIIFALLDSHTEFSGYSNMRVDNYVYTEESFRQARHLLAPRGVLVVKFEVRYPWNWIGQRFLRMLTDVFGRQPVTYGDPPVGSLTGGTVFLESDDDALWKERAVSMKSFIESHPPPFPNTTTGAPAPTTDDWPYIYHRTHSIPATYLTVSALLTGIALMMVRGNFRPKDPGSGGMFLLGAGFLLTETQLVSRLTLYFGTTWMVNSIAISAILVVLVLASLYVERKKPEHCRSYYLLLVISLLANYAIPWQNLPLSSPLIGLALSGAYAVSVFLAGIIFTSTFRRSPVKSGALGANVMGAVAGGLSQNLSFIIGMKALLLLAAACYAGAALAGWRGCPESLPAVRGPGSGASEATCPPF